MNPEKLFEKFYELAATWGLRVIGVLLALTAGWMVAGWVRGVLNRAFTARKFDPTLGRFFANLAHHGILVGLVLSCLDVFGITTTSFAAVIGGVAIGIAMAFQGTLGQFASGVMLLVFRPFKVGDLIRAAGETGVVEEIQLFTTTLTTGDNRYIIVPNSKIAGDTIENMTHFDKRRVDIPVGVAYSASIDETRSVLMAASTKVDGTLDDPAPQVFLQGLGDSAVNWQLRLWCHPTDYWEIWQAGTRAVKVALDDAGIGIPFPQLDVHLEQPASKLAQD